MRVSLSAIPTLFKASCEIGLALKCCVTELYVLGFVHVLKEKGKKNHSNSVSFGDNYSIARLITVLLQCSPLILPLEHSRNQSLF